MSWSWNLGQRSLKVIESGIIRYIVYGFLLVFFSNFVPKMHRFSDIRLKKCRDLENRDRCPSRSWEMSPFDKAHMTSFDVL